MDGRRVALLVVLWPSVLFAAFSTNWPSWQFQREGHSQATQCIAAVNERMRTMGRTQISTNLITTNSGWRLQRQALVECKDKMKQVIGLQLVVPAYFDYITLSGWTNEPDIDYYSNVVRLCRDCGLPTNFFDYTPWRSLNSLGAFTNDQTVGHPYGYTNSFTSTNKAWTNFPGTRTNWYTTDYGWDGMKAVINTCRLWRANVTAGKYPSYLFSDISVQGHATISSYATSNENGSDFLAALSSDWAARGIVTNPGADPIGDFYQYQAIAAARFVWTSNSVGVIRWTGKEIRHSRSLVITNLPVVTNILVTNALQVWQWAVFADAYPDFETNRDVYAMAQGTATTKGKTNSMIPYGSAYLTNSPSAVMPVIGSNTGTEVFSDAGWGVDLRSVPEYGNYTNSSGFGSIGAGIGLRTTNIILMFKWDYQY